MSYFHDIIFIVYNYFISHNITLQIRLHNVTKKTKQTEWDGEEYNNSSQSQRNQSILIDINKVFTIIKNIIRNTRRGFQGNVYSSRAPQHPGSVPIDSRGEYTFPKELRQYFFILSTDIDLLRSFNVLRMIKTIGRTHLRNNGVKLQLCLLRSKNEAGEFVIKTLLKTALVRRL